MIPIDAVELAIARYQNPDAYQDQLEASAPIPSGMDRLLALATGSPWLLEEAALDLGVTADVLRQAVLDLIPQVCFTDDASYYRTLGLGPEASSQQIKDHYRLLLLLYHPDRAETRDWAEQYTVRLNQAYSTLSKPPSRALYDDVLQQSGSLTSTVEWQPKASATETDPDRLKTAIRSWVEQLFGHRTEVLWVLPGLVIMVGLVFLGQSSSVPDSEAGVVAQIAQPTQDPANQRPAVQEVRPSGSHDMPGPVSAAAPVPETAAISPTPEPVAQIDGEASVVEPALDTQATDSPALLAVAQPPAAASVPTTAAPTSVATAATPTTRLQSLSAQTVTTTTAPASPSLAATRTTEKGSAPVGQFAMPPGQPESKPAEVAPGTPQVAAERREVTEPVVPRMVDPRLVQSSTESAEPAAIPVRPAHRPKPTAAETNPTPRLVRQSERPVARPVPAGSTQVSTTHQTLPRQSRTAPSALTTGDVDHLFASYGGAIRSGDIDRVMALFAPDACGPDDRDRDGIRQSYARLFDSNTIRRLQLTNPHSRLRGDQATAIACSVLWLRHRESGTLRQAIGPIRLDLEKRDGRVLIAATDQNWLSPPKARSELTSEEIEEQVERYAEAFRSGDLNRLMGLIKPMDCCNGEADRQAIRQPYAELFGNYMVRRMQLSDIRWDICGDAANVETRYEVWLKKRGNGQPSHRTGTIRLDLQRRDGQVLIVNVEHSWQAS